MQGVAFDAQSGLLPAARTLVHCRGGRSALTSDLGPSLEVPLGVEKRSERLRQSARQPFSMHASTKASRLPDNMCIVFRRPRVVSIVY